jgi:hypothetical protein
MLNSIEMFVGKTITIYVKKTEDGKKVWRDEVWESGAVYSKGY